RVAHSLSPLIHNAAFRKLGLNKVYLPFRVPRADFPGFLNDFQKIPVHGYSVTIPHKEAAAEVAVAAGESVEEIRAANTLVRDEKGFTPYTPASPAAIAALLSGMPTGPDGIPPTVHSRAVLLLGAGGVARALAHGLKEAGALLSIANRTYDRAHRL